MHRLPGRSPPGPGGALLIDAGSPPRDRDVAPDGNAAMGSGPDAVVDALLDRSHRLGSDQRNTNYAGGNASAKGTAIDP